MVERNAAISTADAHTLMRVLAMQEEEDGADNDQEDTDANPKDTGTDPSAPPATTNENGDVNNVNSGVNGAKKNANGAKANGAKENANEEQKPDFRNVKGWHNDLVAAVNAVINELNTTMARCTPEQHRLFKELELNLLEEAFQNGLEKSKKFSLWASLPWKKAVEELAGRVKRTFARRTSGQQPEA
jgi:hypothetical protein